MCVLVLLAACFPAAVVMPDGSKQWLIFKCKQFRLHRSSVTAEWFPVKRDQMSLLRAEPQVILSDLIWNINLLLVCALKCAWF